MPTTPHTSDTVIPTPATADPGLRGPKDAVETTASAAKQVSPPPALIAEYEVLFGTAAAVAIMPTFEDELDDEDVAIQGADAAGETLAAPRRSGWITALARRIRTSRNERPPRRHYPTHLDREFIADARMDREMYRL